MTALNLHRLSSITLPKDSKEADSVKRSKAISRDDRVRGMMILSEAYGHYHASYQTRLDRERNKRYTYGDQWGDMICVDGEHITEGEYIKRQGNVPLKTNLIRRLVRNVVGTYRNQSTEPTCTARDRDEQRQAETMSTVLQYNMQLNHMKEMYARGMEEYLIGAMVVHKKKYTWFNDRMDCWTFDVQPNNFIPDSNMHDFRNWDCSFVGEIHDMSFGQMCQELAHTPNDYQKLSEIYREARDTMATSYMWNDFGYSNDQVNKDFFMPRDPSRCRVIEVWRKESKPRYRCHDFNSGETYKIDIEDYGELVYAENQRRLEMGNSAGIPQEEIPFIKAEWFMDSYWYYYFLSPFGDILDEGESPYEHKSHPYVFKMYPFIDGEIHSFVADVIDQQRYTNRLITMQDFIIRASAKGALLVPEDCLKGQDPQEFADSWTRFNGVIVYTPSKTGHVPQQVSANSTNIGLHELLNLQLKFFEDISGVSGVLQGKPSFSGESGSHAQMMVQNASTSLIDILESYNEFVVDAAYKDVRNIQQYYDEKRIVEIVGRKAAVSPQKVLTLDIDISIAQSRATDAYRNGINSFLMDLFNARAISIEQLLQVGKFDFGDELLQSIQSQKEALQNGQSPEGLSPELAQRVQQGANMNAVNTAYDAVAT